MAKYSGKIGFMSTKEIEPGVWDEEIVEKHYNGDVVRNITRAQSTDTSTDNITVNNSISIVADPFTSTNFQHMRYITFMGSVWEISSVEILYPRILINLGGLYHG